MVYPTGAKISRVECPVEVVYDIMTSTNELNTTKIVDITANDQGYVQLPVTRFTQIYTMKT